MDSNILVIKNDFLDRKYAEIKILNLAYSSNEKLTKIEEDIKRCNSGKWMKVSAFRRKVLYEKEWINVLEITRIDPDSLLFYLNIDTKIGWYREWNEIMRKYFSSKQDGVICLEAENLVLSNAKQIG